MAWRFLDYRSYNIFENMAIDEAIFHETIRNKREPTIRFYGSDPAAVSIGFFQDARKDLNIGQCRRDGIDIVRRITGGRAVFHFNAITYSVIAGDQEEAFPGDISGTYSVISKCLIRGLCALGIKASLAEEDRKRKTAEISACCFSTPTKNEILVDGRKICGSAQVKRRGGFLQHGLLFCDFNPDRTAELLLSSCAPDRVEKLKRSVTAINHELAQPMNVREVCSELRKGFRDELNVALEEESLTPAEERLKQELVKKYTDVDWNIERQKYFKAV